MGNPTTYTNDTAITSRTAEVPDASWGTGGDWAASNAHGLGINFGEGAVVGTPEQFTLLDQDEDPRDPQVSQQIGGVGFVDRSSVDWPSSGGLEGKGTNPIRQGVPGVDGAVGTPTIIELTDLATGWVDQVP